MKPTAAWSELSLASAALIAITIGVMWAQRPVVASCALTHEAPRRLWLSRENDREHLATDLASAERIARGYARQAGTGDQPQTRSADCHASLVQQIATRHGLSLKDVGGGFAEVK